MAQHLKESDGEQQHREPEEDYLYRAVVTCKLSEVVRLDLRIDKSSSSLPRHNPPFTIARAQKSRPRPRFLSPNSHAQGTGQQPRAGRRAQGVASEGTQASHDGGEEEDSSE